MSEVALSLESTFQNWVEVGLPVSTALRPVSAGERTPASQIMCARRCESADFGPKFPEGRILNSRVRGPD